jgi:LysM repeat protein
MRRRSLIIFVLLNVLISLGVAFAVISQFSPQTQTTTSQIVITVPILVTATTDANATPRVIIVTATPLPGSIGALPTGLLETPAPQFTLPVTFDAQALVGDSALQTTVTALPQNCIPHVVQEGDTPFGIAEQYGASGFDVMAVNGLTDETAARLQIGQVLIVPLEGCPLTVEDVVQPDAAAVEETAEATAEATAETTAEPTVRPTLTLPPTATNAQVEIVEVVGAGSVTEEGVVIRNVGNNINMSGWTLQDSSGETYTFQERILFSNGVVTLFSRVGTDTAIALFWNRTSAVFGEPGDVLTLRDVDGRVQSTFRIPSPVSLPGG